jgi:hypothetical protein
MSLIPESGHEWLFLTPIVLGMRGEVEIGRFSFGGWRAGSLG